MLDARPGSRRGQYCDANHDEFVICLARYKRPAVQIDCGAAILRRLLLVRELVSGFLSPFRHHDGDRAGDYVKPTNPAGQERSAMARPDTNWPMPTNTGTGESANNPSLRNVTGENRGAADPWGRQCRAAQPISAAARNSRPSHANHCTDSSGSDIIDPNSASEFPRRIEFHRSVRVSNLEFGRQAACTSPKTPWRTTYSGG